MKASGKLDKMVSEQAVAGEAPDRTTETSAGVPDPGADSTGPKPAAAESGNHGSAGVESGMPDTEVSATMWRARWRFLPLVVIGIAAFVYLFRLASPDGLVFDEVYYARDARSVRLGATALTVEEYNTVSACDRDQYPEGICSWVHPPLGRMLISLGERIGPESCPDPTAHDGGVDCSAFQWRIASAVAGIVVVALVLLLGFVLFRSWVWASLAGALYAFDGLIVTSARIAMLDIFLVGFVVAGFLLLVLARRSAARAVDDPKTAETGTAETGTGPIAFGSGAAFWLLVASGACFGGAIAVKWAGGLALGAAWLLAVAWTARAYRTERCARAESATAGPSPIWPTIAAYAVALIAVPALAYYATWIPYLTAHGWSVTELVALHAKIADYHLGLEADHPYKSPAWQWPLLLRPTAYFYEQTDSTIHVLNIGNPVFWWTSIVALAATLWAALRRIRRLGAAVLCAGLVSVGLLVFFGAGLVVVGSVAAVFAAALAAIWLRDVETVPQIIVIGYGALFLPWLLVPRPQFLFYLAPAVPLMAIAWAWFARRLWGFNRAAKTIVIVCLALMLIAFAALYSVWTAVPIPASLWHMLMVFQSWI